MRPTEKRVTQLKARKRKVDFYLSNKLSEEDLYAIGFEDGYRVDVRTKNPYLPRRDAAYVRGHAAGRRQKAIHIAVELRDPFSDESRLRAAEARNGANDIRSGLAKRWQETVWSNAQINKWWTAPVPFDWVAMLKYEAPMRTHGGHTLIYDAVRNRMTGHWTPYLWTWRLRQQSGIATGRVGEEVLPADASTWAILRAAA